MKLILKTILVASLAITMFFASFGASPAFLDKTRFAAHVGIAYFCFHHWVLAPYREGQFAGGAPHRTATIIKGGAALLFAVHEARVAKRIADKSSDPLLHKVAGGLAALTASFGAIGEKFKSGKFSPQDITELNGEANAVSAGAAADGVHIKDIPLAIPGT